VVPGAVASGVCVRELGRINRKDNISERVIKVLVEIMRGR
jgi:hypothetical protein